MIWYKNYAIKEIKKFYDNTLLTAIGIEITEITDHTLIGEMPVNEKTVQPNRILHGGASVALAESLGSIASYLILDPNKYNCVGLEINANHLRSVPEGDSSVIGTATPLHIGRKTHVWEVKIKNNKNKLICVSRLTVAIIPK